MLSNIFKWNPLGPSLVLLGLVCPRHLNPKSQLAGNGPGLLDHRGPFLLTLGTNEMPNKMARYIEWQSGGRLTGRAPMPSESKICLSLWPALNGRSTPNSAPRMKSFATRPSKTLSRP
jgi:hypothetical protein